MPRHWPLPVFTGPNPIHVEWVLDETDRDGPSFHFTGVRLKPTVDLGLAPTS